jgi:hypothetical protein
MLKLTNENFARLLRALHCSYGVGDEQSYKRALTFLENCERYALRSLVRTSAKYRSAYPHRCDPLSRRPFAYGTRRAADGRHRPAAYARR